jgi:transcriptional regulator with XRE-family HTH domain
MKDRGLTQAALAHACRMHPSHLSTFLSGKADIGATRFLRILEVLGVDPFADGNARTGRRPSEGDSSDRRSPSQVFLLASGLPQSERDALLVFTQRLVTENRRSKRSSSSADL